MFGLGMLFSLRMLFSPLLHGFGIPFPCLEGGGVLLRLLGIVTGFDEALQEEARLLHAPVLMFGVLMPLLGGMPSLALCVLSLICRCAAMLFVLT